MNNIIQIKTSEPEDLSNSTNSSGFLSIPLSTNQFKEFIISLLGTPQTISKRFEGVFDIEKEDLIDIHNLLLQRIGQQNNGTLIQFEAKVYFSDQTSVIMTSIDDFQLYKDHKDVISETVRLLWVFLIKFPNKEIHEKQVVELQLNTNPDKNKIEEDGIITPKFLQSGYVDLKIEHTARTWGADMESLLSSKINLFLIPNSNIKKFIIKYRTIITLLIGIIALLLSLYILSTNIDNEITKHKKNVVEFLDRSPSMEQKIDYLLIGNSNRSNISNSIFFFALSPVLLLVFLMIFFKFITHCPKSFITLTKGSEIYRKKQKTKEKIINFKLWGTILIGIITGVLANYLFKYISNT